MSSVWSENVIAILIADLHFSLTPPVWRSAEPNWMKAQERVCNELRNIQKTYDCPILCAGDICEWDSKPELINWLKLNMPVVYAIPGQHDLPNHQYKDMHRSAFQTLCDNGVIKEIKYKVPFECSDFIVFGFPWEKDIEPCWDNTNPRIKIAIAHQYVWVIGKGYKNAAPELRLTGSKRFNGYDVLVFGDNHIGFTTTTNKGEITVFNCGSLMRRASDEINYMPQIGLLTKDGIIFSHLLKTAEDKYIPSIEVSEIAEDIDLTSVIKGLERLGKTALDFRDSIKEFLQGGKVSKEAKQIIFKAMEKNNE